MAKARTVYVCQNCGRQSPREMGRCPGCGEYNTMVQEIIQPEVKKKTPRGLSSTSTPRRLTEIGHEAEDRMPLAIGEFSRVLGGGIVPGSVILIGGDPGIGKSTLLLQTAMEIAKETPVLYISGEESENQIKMRAHAPGRREERTPSSPKTSTWSPRPTWRLCSTTPRASPRPC